MRKKLVRFQRDYYSFVVLGTLIVLTGILLYISAQLIQSPADPRSYAADASPAIIGPFKVLVTVRNPTQTEATFNLLVQGRGLEKRKTLRAGQRTIATYTTPSLPVSVKADSGTIELVQADIQSSSGVLLGHLGPFSIKLGVGYPNRSYNLSIPAPTPTLTPAPTVVPSTTPVPTTTSPLSYSGFELGNFTGWKREACCSYSSEIVTFPVHSGKYAAKFTLNRTDPVTVGSKRSEIKLATGVVGGEYWYGTSIFIPGDWKKDTAPEIVFQWHNVPDLDLGEDYKQPALGMRIDGDTYRLVSNWDSKPVTIPDQFEGSKTYLLGSIERGTWTTWKIHAKWSWKSDGILEVWKNGTKVVSQSGPNYYNDAKGPYFKIGIYKFPWYKTPEQSIVDQRVLYFDDTFVTNSP